MSRATTSTSPVGSLGLTVSADRARTTPVMPTTNSDRKRFAVPSSRSSTTTWVTPPRSRTSMNSTPPRSRTRCTQPRSVTSASTSAARRAPHVWVLVNEPSWSANLILASPGSRLRTPGLVGALGPHKAWSLEPAARSLQTRLPKQRRDLLAVHRALLPGRHILHCHFRPRRLVVAHHDHERKPACRSVLELLPELVSLRIHVDPQTRAAQ